MVSPAFIVHTHLLHSDCSVPICREAINGYLAFIVHTHLPHSDCSTLICREAINSFPCILSPQWLFSSCSLPFWSPTWPMVISCFLLMLHPACWSSSQGMVWWSFQASFSWLAVDQSYSLSSIHYSYILMSCLMSKQVNIEWSKSVCQGGIVSNIIRHQRLFAIILKRATEICQRKHVTSLWYSLNISTEQTSDFAMSQQRLTECSQVLFYILNWWTFSQYCQMTQNLHKKRPDDLNS